MNKKLLLILISFFMSGSVYAENNPAGMEELISEKPEQIALQQQLDLWENNVEVLAEQIENVQFLVTLAKESEHNKEVWCSLIKSIIQLLKLCNNEDPELIFEEVRALIDIVKQQASQENGIRGGINIQFGSPQAPQQRA